ncbi:GtrA family protein [Acetilactobacillus jinshanensis]|uniref:GtrA family protein n=1 Tax=Acetilactobacillus jinshanensis TaxID=1720083 RepID=A0A4P6ZJQ0_9LACO|nr:GtrA family protein [Acetilactobacillus jinshanensis]QBP17868.1 GtrA family protein [Acetilactobacillus jinshanensis]URL60729.1 GtrA family protein [uncultured bacterium]
MTDLIHKLIFNEKIEYLFWGGMTTLVYFVARFTSMAMMTSEMIPVAIAQTISTVFAFIVNKYLVFNNSNQSKSVTAQFIIFLIGRGISAVFDFLLTSLMITHFYEFFIHIFLLNRINYQTSLLKMTIIHNFVGNPILMNKVICVILIQVIIIVINYIVSKYFAFK